MLRWAVTERSRPTAEQMLAKLQTEPRARLRIYIGAAPGVGKTYAMIEDAHTFRREGVDVVIGFVESHGRADTEARIDGLEIVPRRRIDYRGVVLEEMDVDAILARKPGLCVVDELAHTNVAGSRHQDHAPSDTTSLRNGNAAARFRVRSLPCRSGRSPSGG